MRVIARLIAIAVVLLTAAPAPASAALTATGVRIGAQSAYVRVVVDLSGATFTPNEAAATDAAPQDGAARVDLHRAGIRVRTAGATGQGVRVRVGLTGASSASIRMTSVAGRFKYVRLTGLHSPERLVIDLYTSAPPPDAAEIRSAPGGCLALTRVRRAGTSFKVRGTAHDLFEGAFELLVRDARGRIVGRRTVTAHGAWGRSLPYVVTGAQVGTVEAVAASAKDGSLACLAQVRVALVK